MGTPEVTVIMAVYNGMPYLPEAMESILEQSFGDFEFLIVNDCSTDDTREVILSYADPRIRLIDNETNIRQTRSLNRGLQLAQGQLVARMDADDLSHAERIEKQVAFLRNEPGVAALGSNLRFIDEKGKPIGFWSFPERDLALRWMQLFYNPISNGAVMFRKAVIWDELGGFDSEVVISQDWELWGRLLQSHRIASLPEVLLDVRQHAEQETARAKELLLKDSRDISMANACHILKVNKETESWVSDLHMLPHSAYERRKDNVQRFVFVLEKTYERFCTLYPEAKGDRQVQKILALRYFEAAENAGLGDLSIALKAIHKAFPRISRSTFFYCFFRWFLTVCGLKPQVLRRTPLYRNIYNLHSTIMRKVG
jgi:glycosyltransferase involved in cell wall biosynthesis